MPQPTSNQSESRVIRRTVPSQYEMRGIANALPCQARTGCQRRYLPHDLPPKSAVCSCFGWWREDGTTAVVLDSQAVWPRRTRRRERPGGGPRAGGAPAASGMPPSASST
ncbi:transposase [Streptomyces sp. NPDC000609]|uniref:transposase n=1 Tax=Streptomyces sp. NPDC000609 TaxID=3160957 RepID=UPI0033973F1A